MQTHAIYRSTSVLSPIPELMLQFLKGTQLSVKESVVTQATYNIILIAACIAISTIAMYWFILHK